MDCRIWLFDAVWLCLLEGKQEIRITKAGVFGFIPPSPTMSHSLGMNHGLLENPALIATSLYLVPGCSSRV